MAGFIKAVAGLAGEAVVLGAVVALGTAQEVRRLATVGANGLANSARRVREDINDYRFATSPVRVEDVRAVVWPDGMVTPPMSRSQAALAAEAQLSMQDRRNGLYAVVMDGLDPFGRDQYRVAYRI